MKEEILQSKKQLRKAEPVQTGDLDKAIERIYQKYGNDLQAFFRSVYKEAHTESEQSESAQVETYALLRQQRGLRL